MQEYFNFAISHWELSAALLITLAMLSWNLFGERIQGYTTLSTQEAISVMNQDKAIVLDVRETKELDQTGIISGAEHVRLSEVKNKADTVLGADKTRPVLAVCRTGNRSAMACGKLRKLGFQNVYNLKGGVLAWKKSGYPLTKSS